MKRRRNPSLPSLNTLTLLALGGGVYFLYQYIKQHGIPNPVAPIGEAIGSGVFDVLNPGAAGASVTYIATTPSGAKVVVNNNSLDPSNNFSYKGQTYHLSTDGTGARIATPVTEDILMADFSNAGNF
jgi:hypothetical protein